MTRIDTHMPKTQCAAVSTTLLFTNTHPHILSFTNKHMCGQSVSTPSIPLIMVGVIDFDVTANEWGEKLSEQDQHRNDKTRSLGTKQKWKNMNLTQ